MHSCPGPVDSYREQLLLRHLPQVQHIARRIHEHLPPQVSIEDLVQCGILGLIDAVRRYDPSKNVNLKYYAEHRIRGAILDSLREVDCASRAQRRIGRRIQLAIAKCRTEFGREPTESEIASVMGMKLEALQRIKAELRVLEIASLDADSYEVAAGNAIWAATQEDDPYHGALKSELAGIVEKAVGTLPARERELLDMYYVKEATMKEIAAALGVGESRVSQIHSSILCRLRAKCAVAHNS
jgi:RNA polymerase sigma factor for flagellar operon FliA